MADTSNNCEQKYFQQWEEIGEILLNNTRDKWAQILADHFNTEISLVETICKAYFELTPEHFKTIIDEANEYKHTYYKTLLDGQRVIPTDEDIIYAEEINSKTSTA